MQTIGLIGGITPQSTIMYYQVLNDLAEKKYGEFNSCKVIINSVNFAEIGQLQKENRWDKLDKIMSDTAISLEQAGAKSILICANTMHLTIDAVRNAVKVPVIHIAEATSVAIKKQQLKKVALLGTKYTMEMDFYKDVLKSFDIEVIIPNEEDRLIVNDVIYKELAKGILKKESKELYLKIINSLILDGAEGIILGCTEIPLLIKQEDVSVPVFDTTAIHAAKAFSLATTL
jgi:aspartate racemase